MQLNDSDGGAPARLTANLRLMCDASQLRSSERRILTSRELIQAFTEKALQNGMVPLLLAQQPQSVPHDVAVVAVAAATSLLADELYQVLG